MANVPHGVYKIALFTIGFRLFAGLAHGMMLIIIPYILNEYDVRYESYGAIYSMGRVVYVAVGFVIPFMVPQASRLLVISSIGLLLYPLSVLMGVAGVLHLLAGIGIGLIAHNLSSSIREISVSSIALEVSGRFKATLTSVLRSVLNVASVASPILAYLLLATVGLVNLIYVVALLAFASLVTSFSVAKYFTLREPHLSGVCSIKSAISALRSMKGLGITIALLALDTPVWALLAPFTLLIILREGGFDVSVAALHDFIVALTIALMGPFAGYLSDIFKRRWEFLGVSELVGVGYVTLLFTAITQSNMYLVLAAAALSGVTSSLWYGAHLALLSEARRGSMAMPQVLALQRTLGHALSIPMPAIGGLLLELGTELFLTVLTTLLATLALTYLTLARHLKSAKAET